MRKCFRMMLMMRMGWHGEGEEGSKEVSGVVMKGSELWRVFHFNSVRVNGRFLYLKGHY